MHGHELTERLRACLAAVAALGAGAPAAFVAVYATASVLFVPASLLTLGAGAIFGPLKGTALVSIAATSGATASFLIGRYLARDWVSRRIAGNPTFKAIDESVAKEGWRIVGLARLSPVLPFSLLNYAFGLTRVSLREFVLASWIGMLPGTALYVYLGSLAGSLASLGGPASRPRGPAQWALLAVGLAATAGVAAVSGRIAREALGKRIP